MDGKHNHTLTMLQPAYRPRRRCVRGANDEGANGYPADDQPTAAVFKCSCGWVGDADDCDDGRECPKCGEGET